MPPEREALSIQLPLTYDWSYHSRGTLTELYAKAVSSQWTAASTLPWHTDVDLEGPLLTPEDRLPIYGSDIFARMTRNERRRLQAEIGTWRLSQFMHGEQGALMAAAQLVAAAPDLDAKFYAATQVQDEARHVEVYERYLREKIGASYPITGYLRKVLDLVLTDARWDIKLLGMQICIEGLALAAFRVIRDTTEEPLLREMLRYVLLDEARHVAFGVLSLEAFYREAGEAVRREREDFLYEACVLLLARSQYQEVWERIGLPVAACVEATRTNPVQQETNRRLFARIVPAIKRIGLLSERQRDRFAALGILEYETAPLELG
jgi:hypothetical protein